MKPFTQDIVLTHFDHQRLHGMLRVLRERAAVSAWHLDALELELRRAQTVAAERIPPDVITMNSKVVLRDLATGEQSSLTLVFPDALAYDPERLSILSPLGLALLGCRVGDKLQRDHNGTQRTLLVEKVVYQPESTGNFFM